jgi:hypothetical protein
MKLLLLTTIGVLLLACNSGQEAEIKRMKNEVATLRQQMDSIIYNKPLVLSAVSEKPVKAKKKAGPAATALYTPPVRKASSSGSFSGACQAITKRGSQCSRKPRSGGYCWQHGG